MAVERLGHTLKIVKESGISLTGSLVAMGLNYVLLVIITRFLGPGEYGTFVLALSIINVSLSLVLLGTPRALDRFIPFYNAAGEQGKIRTLLRRVFRMCFVNAAVVAPVLFLLAGFLSRRVFHNLDLAVAIRVMVLSVPMFAVVRLVSFAFIGFKELRYQVYLQHLFLPVLKIGLAIAFFSLGYGFLGCVWMHVTSLAATCVLALWFFRRRLSPLLSVVEGVRVPFREIISYSWPLSITGIASMLMGQIDFLFLGRFRPVAEVGVYRVYVYIVAVLGLALLSFAKVYKPVVSELISRRQYEEVGRTYKRVSKWVFLINSFVLLVIVLFGTDIVGALFTKSYAVATAGLLILTAGRFAFYALGPQEMTLEAFGNTKLSMLNAVIIVGANIGLDYLLVPRYGIVGAAIAASSAMVLGGVAGLIEIYVLYGLRPFDLGYFKYAAVVLAAGGLTHLLARQVAGRGIPSLLVLIVLLAVIYLAGLRWSRSLDAVDFEVMKRIKAKLSVGG